MDDLRERSREARTVLAICSVVVALLLGGLAARWEELALRPVAILVVTAIVIALRLRRVRLPDARLHRRR